MYSLTINVNSDRFETLLFRNKPTRNDILDRHLCPSSFVDSLLESCVSGYGEVRFCANDLSEMDDSSTSFLSRYGSGFGYADIFYIVLEFVNVIEN